MDATPAAANEESCAPVQSLCSIPCGDAADSPSAASEAELIPEAPHLPPEVLQLVLPHARLAPGHVPHSVCRAWRDALGPMDITAKWIMWGLCHNSVLKAMQLVCKRRDNHLAAATIMHFFLHHFAPHVDRRVALQLKKLTDPAAREKLQHRAWLLEVALKPAAAAGNATLLALLIPQDPSFQGAAFLAAAEAGQIGVMTPLSQGTDSSLYSQAMQAAAAKGQVAAMQLLMEWIDQGRPVYLPVGSPTKDSILQAAMGAAAAAGQLESLTFLLDLGVSYLYGIGSACRAGKWGAARLLLTRSLDAASAAMAPPLSDALAWAITGGQSELCESMIALGCEIDQRHMQAMKHTPADVPGRGAVRELLLPLAARKPNLLADAARDADIDLMQELLPHKPEQQALDAALQAALSPSATYHLAQQLDPVWNAAQTLRAEAVAVLLIDSGASLKHLSCAEQTNSLAAAVRASMMDVVKRFMRWGCLPGAERSIVLMGAAQRGHQAICRLLVAGGADPNILKPFLLTAVQTMDVPLYNNYMKSGVLPEVLLREAQEALHQQYETVHGMIGTFEELQLQQELRAMRVVSTVFYKGSLL